MALLAAACSEPEDPVVGGAVRTETTSTTTTDITESPNPETGEQEDDDEEPGLDTDSEGELRHASGSITVGGQVYVLDIELCEIEVEEDWIYVEGNIEGHPGSLFEISRLDYEVFGVEDLAFVLIGNPDAPSIYWEASPISQGESGAGPLFLQLEGRSVTGTAWFEDRREPTSGETILDGDIVSGSIEVSC